MELLVTVKEINRVNRLLDYPIDGIIVGSHFASCHHYSLKDLRTFKTICRANQKKMYILMDEMIEEKDRSLLYEYLEFLRDIEVDDEFLNSIKNTEDLLIVSDTDTYNIINLNVLSRYEELL